jgi:hypothetical protein
LSTTTQYFLHRAIVGFTTTIESTVESMRSKFSTLTCHWFSHSTIFLARSTLFLSRSLVNLHAIIEKTINVGIHLKHYKLGIDLDLPSNF